VNISGTIPSHKYDNHNFVMCDQIITNSDFSYLIYKELKISDFFYADRFTHADMTNGSSITWNDPTNKCFNVNTKPNM